MATIDCPSPPTLQPAAAGDEALVGLLAGLYREQLALTPENGYLAEHGRDVCIRNHVSHFAWYRRWLPEGGNVLDWGCNHAPDSCLLRTVYGDRLRRFGCDFGGPERFAAFFACADLTYAQLTHPYQLPYEDQVFDAVIASGVLEHTANDSEALKQVHRVLKPDGVLVITYLPNRWSVQEWYRRVVVGRHFHRRLYAPEEARQMLLHHGFLPLAGGYDPYRGEGALSLLPRSWRRPLAGALNALPLLRVVGSTLRFVARKVLAL